MSRLWPWIFVLGMAAGSMLPLKRWLPPQIVHMGGDGGALVRRIGSGDVSRAVDVLYTIDGDTFGARIHLPDGDRIDARIRLRGIDAPELKGRCSSEIRRAETATTALRQMLGEGDVRIFHIGPDKYGRVVADVATRRTPDVSAALLAGGYARRYDGGHRDGWC